MSWTDEEIDKLARESAANSSVEFKPEYWTEFEKMLPASGKKDFLWIFTAFLFVGLMGTTLVFNGLESNIAPQNATNASPSRQLAQNESELSAVNETDNQVDSESDSLHEMEGEATVEKANENISLNNSNRSGQNQRLNAGPSVTKKSGMTPETIQMGMQPDLLINTNEISSEPINNEQKSEYVASTKSETTELPISNLPLLGFGEFSVNTSLLPGMEFSKQKMPASASFYVNGFGGLSQSLITPSRDISTSFGLGLGAQIQKGKFTFTTGVNGVWSNHKDLNLSRSTKVYGFGSNEYNYQFKYKQIYSLEAELTAGYRMGRHLINVGVRPSFIIGTKVAVVESINDKKTIDRNEYGYVDGLYRFGIKPTLGYSFDITSTLKIGVNLGVEMMPKIRDGYLVGSSSKYPVDGQLYLRKAIRFKK